MLILSTSNLIEIIDEAMLTLHASQYQLGGERNGMFARRVYVDLVDQRQTLVVGRELYLFIDERRR